MDTNFNSVNRKEPSMINTMKYIAKNLLHIIAAAIVGSLLIYLNRNVHTELISALFIGMVSYMAIDDLIIWVKHIINGNDEEWNKDDKCFDGPDLYDSDAGNLES